jgi:streptomycin 6-kinase
MIVDPSECAGYIVDIHGERGRAWLRGLPGLIAACAQRWSLTVLPPFKGLSYNYVTPAIRADGTPVVIKAGVPHIELWCEIDALRLLDGDGTARLLDADPAGGALLLERLLPGTPLSDVPDDDEVTRVTAEVIRRQWKPVPVGNRFATVRGWVAGFARLRGRFGGGAGPLPERQIALAEALFAELLAGSARETLIHGDPHPQNILRAERKPWLAIDPKGVVGDPLYDLATFINSYPDDVPDADWLRGEQRRAAQLAELLNLDARLLLRWALGHLIMAGWWTFEDHGRGWEKAFHHAAVLEQALR